MKYHKEKEEDIVDDIPKDLIGFWEATEEEQKEIDEILAELNIESCILLEVIGNVF